MAFAPEGSLVRTYLPGTGNLTLVCSVVGHELMLAMFATNMLGSSDISDPSPPEISAEMQFM